MGHMEHLLNVYANKAAKGSIADFVGYIEVAEEQATTKLTQGVWLVSIQCTSLFTCRHSNNTLQQICPGIIFHSLHKNACGRVGIIQTI